ncbi:MAG: hypothetical protein KF832_18650 [Caldilineaceae bacterium]|nr:hypothetical protein [Caldilineaceae bacterium]
MQEVPLHWLAHGRTGDKGNCSNISVIAYRPAFFPLLVEQVTVARVARLFQARRPTTVHRYVLPKLAALNFVLEDVLDGGVNEALNLDSHGKTLAFFLLELPVAVSPAMVAEIKTLRTDEAPLGGLGHRQ